MPLLAIVEHLQKIPFLLSLFLPVVLFFLAGLGLAWWIWYRHARSLQAALAEHKKLSQDIARVAQKDHRAGTRFANLFSKHQSHWTEQADNDQKKIDDLSLKLSKENKNAAALKLSLQNLKSENEREKQSLLNGQSESKSKISENQAQLDKCLATHRELSEKVTNLEAKLKERDDKIFALNSINKDKDREISSLKSSAQASLPPAQATPIASLAKSFQGEPIKEDSKLGLIFTERPKEIDDLKLIKGVANVLEGKLHEFGVYRFKQIMLWNKAQIDEFSERLSFPDRIERDEWVKQATQFHLDKYGS